MTDDYVLPPPDDVAGTKKLQTKLNTVGVNDVHAECIYLVKSDGTDNPIHQVQSNSANIATEATVESVKTAVETLDNCISGNEAQADVLTVRDVQPGYAAANLGKRAASETHAQYDVGVMALAVRNDDNVQQISPDNGYGALAVDNVGRLKLAAGALAIGKLAANDGVDIGNVDVTSIAAGDNNIGNVDVVTLPNTSTSAPTIYNVTMTNPDAEYSQALGTIKKFLIHTRDETEFRLAFVTGKVATPTIPWFTVLANEVYYEDNVNQSVTLYFASASAGKIIEIIAWG